ncbi:glycoside hydrolase family 3 N-terminal domain-containing protein [Microbacterium sp. UBA3486]|uniref:glycoside hydrolase family 3 N-terminal domain-containing protein n=1 Tax=Microbacterium TaxID=33882 RepID=UPI0025D0B9C6|nr:MULTISPECIES: glycoside hydrolase family 3 N-terminal domain-containing protein [Microbacterium]
MSAIAHPYQDRTLTVDQRVEDLLTRMTLEDKAGQMFQPMATLGDDLDAPGLFGSPSMRTIIDRDITHVNILQAPSAREIAAWHNALQEEARRRGLGIPFSLSSDPRHSFSNNPAAALIAGPFSQWPEFLGFGAIDDPELTRRFAEVVRREYLAVGIRTALHPQIDLATEPRWARASGTFGQSAEVTGRLGVAYTLGLQGDELGAESVSAMAKHFPGGGPQLDGEDPHFSYGREQVYPGGRFDLHLQPFRDLLAAGVSQIMPYYGMPIGTEYEEVGFGFNKQIIQGLLRDELGFDGIVCTDWGILSRTFWGVESLTYDERMMKSLDAGVDQFGGEFNPKALIGLVRAGSVPESRLDTSVRRLLREKFRLGLFDDARFVDVQAADAIVGREDARAAGLEAQARSLTLLTNGGGAAHLPLQGRPTVYVEGLDPVELAGWADVVTDPDRADVAIVRTDAPWEPRGNGADIESFFRAGSLEFHDDELAHLRDLAARVPLVLDVYLDRPAILAPLLDVASTIIANYGASDTALVNVLFGAVEPQGSLPFEVPSSMEAVAVSRPDVPSDTVDPSFAFGHGLRYLDWSPAARPDPASTTIEMADVAAPGGRFDLTSATVAQVLADAEALAIITELVPELPGNPMLAAAQNMPLDTVLGFAGATLPAETIDTLRSRLVALPA